jgi:GT2 family glycosyltransferase
VKGEDSPVLSIVVCTYNRADQLRRCLEALARMTPPRRGPCEVIVVDNNSSDATPAVVEAFRTDAGHPVRYVFERRQGLAYARNTGIRASAAPLVACTDDDCLPAPDWAATLVNEFAGDCSLAVLGGRVDLYDACDAALGIRTTTERRCVDSVSDVFALMIGCNLAFRRDVFTALGGYDVRFGRPGGTTGDDVDFVYRAVRRGFSVMYSPRSLVLHAHGRRTPPDIRATQRMYARGKGAFFGKHVSAGDWRLLRNARWTLARGDAPHAAHRQFVRDFVAGAAYFLRRRFAASDGN